MSTSTQIRRALKSGLPTVGSWMQIPSPSLAELMGAAGYDWVAIDREHGSIGLTVMADICRALELNGTVPLARVAENSCTEIKQVLEAGCRGVIVPMIESRADLENAIAWAKYPPKGRRGVGFSRANLFGQRFSTHFPAFNDESIVVAQIESIGAINALDEILSVPDVDAMIIGPYDLSASMGITGQFGDPRFAEVINRAQHLARHHAVPMGIHVVQPDPAMLRAKIADGYQFIAYGIDAVFVSKSAANPLQTR